jgi:hypothetical protein
MEAPLPWSCAPGGCVVVDANGNEVLTVTSRIDLRRRRTDRERAGLAAAIVAAINAQQVGTPAAKGRRARSRAPAEAAGALAPFSSRERSS